MQGELGRGFARARLWCNRTEVRAAIVCGDTEESVDSLGAPDQAARRSAWAPGPQTRRRWAHSLPPPCPGNYTPSPLSKFNPLDAPLKGVWLSRTTFGPSALIRQLVNAGDECVADSPLLWGSPHAFAAPARTLTRNTRQPVPLTRRQWQPRRSLRHRSVPARAWAREWTARRRLRMHRPPIAPTP